MGDMLPDMIPGEPRWWGDIRAALVVLFVLALVVAASSVFVWVMGR
jgi:hypothetical protein